MAAIVSVGGFAEPLHDQGHQHQGAGQGQQEGGGHRGLERQQPSLSGPVGGHGLLMAELQQSPMQ